MHIEPVGLRRTAISHGGKHFECRRTAHYYGCIHGSWIIICGRTRSENLGICKPIPQVCSVTVVTASRCLVFRIESWTNESEHLIR